MKGQFWFNPPSHTTAKSVMSVTTPSSSTIAVYIRAILYSTEGAEYQSSLSTDSSISDDTFSYMKACTFCSWRSAKSTFAQPQKLAISVNESFNLFRVCLKRFSFCESLLSYSLEDKTSRSPRNKHFRCAFPVSADVPSADLTARL